MAIYEDSLFETIKIIAKKEFDKTYSPKLTRGIVFGISGNEYEVEILGTTHTIPSVSGAKHKINETVWVCQPYGDTNQQFILGGEINEETIIGTVNSVSGKTGNVTLNKSDIGLSNVENIQQATKQEFDSHLDDFSTHTTLSEKTLWNTVSDKADKTSILTPVPENAKFTDTVTTVNGKTGVITKDDVIALGIPSQDTIYAHPLTHPATMIEEDDTHRFVTSEEKTLIATGNHVHNNLPLLQTITQVIVDGWNSAVSHITDKIKHITSSERNLWNTVSDKVDKITGKQLSTEDYTTSEKIKLNNIEENANNYIHSPTHPATMITGLSTVATSGNYNDLGNKPIIPTNTSQLNNDSGYLTSISPHNHTKYQITDMPTKLSEFEDDIGASGGSSDIDALIFDKLSAQLGNKTIESKNTDGYFYEVRNSSTNTLLADKIETSNSISYITTIRTYQSDGVTVANTIIITESKNGVNYETIIS